MRAVVLACLCLVVLGGLPLTGAQSTPGPGESSTQTDLIVQLEADGDARWTVETRLRIEGQNETRAFRNLGRQFVAGDRQVPEGPESFGRIATRVSAETGREMAVEELNRSWRIENESSRPGQTATANASVGVLSFSFTWTNFARTAGDRVVVGDAFETGDRWLPELRAGQRLVIRAPENYSITRANVGHTRTTLSWEGPTEFEPDALRVTFTSTKETTREPDEPLQWSLPISLEGLLAVLAAVVVAAVAYGVTRRSATEDGTAVDRSTADPTADRPTPSPSGETDDETDPLAGVDEDLLSDEERIERHLQSAGGRMKQAEIVERTGWSNAKVSQVLSQMDEDGRVDKLRIGRENLISLPEEE